MLTIDMQGIRTATVARYEVTGERVITTVLLSDGRGGEVRLFVTPAQAEAIAAAFAPQVNEVGVPVLDKPGCARVDGGA